MWLAGAAELGSGEASLAVRARTHQALLADGTGVTLRPIRPDDAEALAEFNRRLSSESLYLRYFSFRRGIGERELDRFTHADGRLHAGVVAFVGGELVGHACFDRKEGELDAEVAFEVADAFQGRGLGTLLLEALIRQARGEGIYTFTARVLPQNRKSLEVFRDLGLAERTRFEEGCVLVSLDLAPTPASRAAERRRHARARSARTRDRSARERGEA
jgi:RimJ/RimL family protein N-acetyltransferase